MTSRTTSFIGLVLLVAIALIVPSAVADGAKVQATVSFGQWQTDPPLDRFFVPNDRTRNDHFVIPQQVKIKAGGAVNFIISGFHAPTIYDAGTQPDDINPDLQLAIPPVAVPLINDPTNRIFRGVDPRTVSQDRVESVSFHKPGTYLVICAVHPHFVNDKMFGFVKVTGHDEGD